MSPLFSFSNLKTQFSGLTFFPNKRLRIWATQQLREFIVKSFVLDDERLKNPDQPFDYFKELLPNPNGIESISPGLRGTSYPGWTKMEFTTPTGLQCVDEARGCNPFRGGEFWFAVSQGSACRATLGWMAESRWDSRTGVPLFPQLATIGFLTLNDRNVLTHAGKISHQLAVELAEAEYEKFNRHRIRQTDAAGGEFEKAIKQLPLPPKRKKNGGKK